MHKDMYNVHWAFATNPIRSLTSFQFECLFLYFSTMIWCAWRKSMISISKLFIYLFFMLHFAFSESMNNNFRTKDESLNSGILVCLEIGFAAIDQQISWFCRRRWWRETDIKSLHGTSIIINLCHQTFQNNWQHRFSLSSSFRSHIDTRVCVCVRTAFTRFVFVVCVAGNGKPLLSEPILESLNHFEHTYI